MTKDQIISDGWAYNFKQELSEGVLQTVYVKDNKMLVHDSRENKIAIKPYHPTPLDILQDEWIYSYSLVDNDPAKSFDKRMCIRRIKNIEGEVERYEGKIYDSVTGKIEYVGELN